jgi:hypothetical protein
MSDVDWRTIETDPEIQLAQERQDNERLTAELNESERQTRAQLSRVMKRDERIDELQADKDRILKDRAKIYRENGELRARVDELERAARKMLKEQEGECHHDYVDFDIRREPQCKLCGHIRGAATEQGERIHDDAMIDAIRRTSEHVNSMTPEEVQDFLDEPAATKQEK